jgi:hypothetical protein
MSGNSRWVFFWAAIFLLLTTSITNTSSENGTGVDDGTILAVQYIDYSCYQQTLDCEASESEHIVEYFGADWCEPCHLVEDELANLNRTDTVIMQHHASSEDYSYLNYSKFRFDDKYRLLFIPTIVVDGKGLLTGSSQSFDLNQSLSTHNGLQNDNLSEVVLRDDIVYWNHSNGQRLTIWRLDSTQHENRNFTHQYLATDSLTIDFSDSNISNLDGVNISGMLQNWSGRLIFILENNGTPEFQHYSDETAGNMDLIDSEKDDINLTKPPNPAQYALIWFAIMLLLITPALILWTRETKRPKQSIYEQE